MVRRGYRKKMNMYILEIKLKSTLFLKQFHFIINSGFVQPAVIPQLQFLFTEGAALWGLTGI